MSTVESVPEPKTRRVNLRVAASDDTLFRHAAAQSDESLSDFLVESARERAERVLADRTTFVLDEDQWKAFQAGIERPPEVRPALVKLFARRPPE